ncbi:MAG: hypothetical protein J7604_05050 [Sporocytophaga sp.]|uniref:hypothetical protein n=1 Tax=Sporocytophaga sp. TaxID=2231183 RepID=UPI001B2CC9AD|nr:hypothetical protein [Sporocytophaga sp.]MBO9699555.1 hypothetical protein [Sporocytophaga sp.]
MARQKGIIKINGSLGGITFYQQNGENFTRETNGPSKEKIQSDPAFRRTRENNQEFAGSAAAGKALRLGLQTYLDVMSDSRVTSALMKQFRIMVNRADSGTRGQRPIEILKHKDLLVGFNFNRFTLFDSVFMAPYSVAVNTDRTAATFTIPDFSTDNSIHVPSGATHLRIIATASALSSYEFDESSKKYVPTDIESNTRNASASSVFIPIGGFVGATTELTPTITPAPALLATSALVACIGIEFYQMVASKPYLLAQGNSMKITNVF